MKILLGMALIVAVACGAAANTTMGLFFDDFTGRTPAPEWDGETLNTNIDVVTTSGFNGPFAWAYLVIINSPVPTIQGIEFGILTGAEWVDGWASANTTVFGEGGAPFTQAEDEGDYSSMTLWTTPFEVGEATALMRFRIAVWDDTPVDVKIGPIWHVAQSMPNTMVMASGGVMYAMAPPVDLEEVNAQGYATVATFFGDGVTATEDRTLSGVKALFR